VFPALPVLG